MRVKNASVIKSFESIMTKVCWKKILGTVGFFSLGLVSFVGFQNFTPYQPKPGPITSSVSGYCSAIVGSYTSYGSDLGIYYALPEMVITSQQYTESTFAELITDCAKNAQLEMQNGNVPGNQYSGNCNGVNNYLPSFLQTSCYIKQQYLINGDVAYLVGKEGMVGSVETFIPTSPAPVASTTQKSVQCNYGVELDGGAVVFNYTIPKYVTYTVNTPQSDVQSESAPVDPPSPPSGGSSGSGVDACSNNLTLADLNLSGTVVAQLGICQIGYASFFGCGISPLVSLTTVDPSTGKILSQGSTIPLPTK